MRKQTKVLAAAALFTLGASFSAFAAKTGKWVLEDEGWMCYDKDGDPYTNEWCLSAGKEFYMGDDGLMVTSDWVEYDNNHYYVGSNGAKTISDWRYVTPIDDEEADEEWFYFDNKGKRVDNKKKVIGGKTYYFDNDGIMLTGWVDTKGPESEATAVTDYVVYCDENGARVEKAWIKVYHPDVDVEEDDLDNEDMHWYWLNADGKPARGKKANIKGESYYFDSEGRMLTGWVAEINTSSNVEYIEIGTEDEKDGRSISHSDFKKVFFCGEEDDGHAKKNKWIKTWKNTEYYEQDTDDDQEWFWIGKDGEVFVPNMASATNATKVKFEEGELVDYSDSKNYVSKTINKKTYAFNANGEMISGFVRLVDDGEVLYFGGGNDGTLKTGTMNITDNCGDSYKFCFGSDDKNDAYKKYVGVTGNKGGKLYEDGLLVTPTTYKYGKKTLTIAGQNYDFVVNASGTVQTSRRVYEDGDFYLDLRNATFNKAGLDSTKNSYSFSN